MQFDRKWETDPGFVFYDFNHPDDLPSDLEGTFELAVIDPPFITKEVTDLLIYKDDFSFLT
jgi:EEF1A lysine methyltransferase 1